MDSKRKQIVQTDEASGLLRVESVTQKRRWSKMKICCICCAVCVLVVLAGIGGFFIYISTKQVDLGDVNKWSNLLAGNGSHSGAVNINGSYKLVAVEDNYRTYLEAMGIPFFVIPLILSGSERLNITAAESGDSMKVITITDWMTRESEFKFGEMFTMPYGKGSMSGILHNFCTKAEENTIECRSDERTKGWELYSTLSFSPGGMINTREFRNKNIVTKKYYEKEGADSKDTQFLESVGGGPSTEAKVLAIEEEEDDGWFDDEWK